MPIDAIAARLASVAPAARTASATAAAPAAAGGFGESLTRMLAAVDESAAAANSAVANMIDGSGDVHSAMIAMQRADMTLQLTVQVRNKLVTAYQDIMRMPI